MDSSTSQVADSFYPESENLNAGFTVRLDEPRFDSVLVMNGYSNYGTLISNTQPEIVSAIQQLHVENEVITEAIKIFYEINSSRIQEKKAQPRTKSVKGSRKLRLEFYCVFMAYSNLNYPVDPCYAADIVGLPRNEVEQALNEYAPTGVTMISPERMTRFYVNRMNQLSNEVKYNVDSIDIGVQKVIEICQSTNAGREWIQNTAARIVAISSLYFYLNDIKGLEIWKNIQIFEKACYLSWACIRRYHEKISEYYNSNHQEVELPPMKLTLPF